MLILNFILQYHKFSSFKTGTSLPRYYSYYPHFEAARERHIFVPKHFPNENPSDYEHKGFQHFKDVCLEIIGLFFHNFILCNFSWLQIRTLMHFEVLILYHLWIMLQYQNRMKMMKFIVLINRKCLSKFS